MQTTGADAQDAGRAPAETSTSPCRYATPTGEPCPRSLRLDGGIEGTGHCHGCGACLLGTGLL